MEQTDGCNKSTGGRNPSRGGCLGGKGSRVEGNLRLPVGAVSRVQARRKRPADSPFVAVVTLCAGEDFSCCGSTTLAQGVALLKTTRLEIMPIGELSEGRDPCSKYPCHKVLLTSCSYSKSNVLCARVVVRVFGGSAAFVCRAARPPCARHARTSHGRALFSFDRERRVLRVFSVVLWARLCCTQPPEKRALVRQL